jgi:hypothetical protein
VPLESFNVIECADSGESTVTSYAPATPMVTSDVLPGIALLLQSACVDQSPLIALFQLTAVIVDLPRIKHATARLGDPLS